MTDQVKILHSYYTTAVKLINIAAVVAAVAAAVATAGDSGCTAADDSTVGAGGFVGMCGGALAAGRAVEGADAADACVSAVVLAGLDVCCSRTVPIAVTAAWAAASNRLLSG